MIKIKIFSFLIGFVLLSQLSAQNYNPLLGETNEWNIVTSVFEGVGTYPYFANRDTIINNLKYKILEEPFNGTYLTHGYLREDTLNRKIYIRTDSSSIDINEEFIYLDFSLETGDTIELYQVNWSGVDTLNKFVVDSITFISTNFGDRKAIHLSGEHCGNNWGYYEANYPDGYRNPNVQLCRPIWIEGVGSLSCSIFPHTEPYINYEIPEYSDNILSCFHRNGELVFQADFSLQLGCIISYGWGAVDENSTKSKIFVYPLPTSGRLEIKNESHENFELSLIDLRGKVMFSSSLEDFNIKELNISELSNGLYFLQFKSENNPAFYKKIIKI